MDTEETSTYNAVLIAAVVIGTIIGYFVISVIRQQRKLLISQKAKTEAEISTLERERARVAADLHDELGPTLSAAKFKLSSIENLSAADEKAMLHAMEHIDNILKQVRQISNGLMPNSLLAKGPVCAIREFINHIHRSTSLKISLMECGTVCFARPQYIHVYRMLQEIIHNTIRHANAGRLMIRLSTHKNKLMIAAIDDGVGFNKAAAEKKDHLGLHNLQSRADILNGSLHIRSAEGKGTGIFIEIPYTS